MMAGHGRGSRGVLDAAAVAPELGHAPSAGRSERALPTVIVSSVIRSTHQGESHGGVYLVDLERESSEQVIDWNDQSIDWEGRGADRGLRGIDFWRHEVYLAASDEVFIHDRNMRRLGTLSNPFLKHCHEIMIDGDLLYLTSTGFDSVLVVDLPSREFVRGFHLDWSWPSARALKLRRAGVRPVPRLRTFDPNAGDGPPMRDRCHINHVFAQGGRILVSGTGMGWLLEIKSEQLRKFARIPYGTHNARPFRDGVLMNHTASDAVLFTDRHGKTRRKLPVPRYAFGSLSFTDVPGDHARQAFGRGLEVDGSHIICGSSPATVTVHDLDRGTKLAQIQLTNDIRNAVHGLAVWPFSANDERLHK